MRAGAAVLQPGPAQGVIRCRTDGRVFLEEGEKAAYEHRYFVGDDCFAQCFASALPGELADLVDVALAVYAADRLVKRPGRRSERYEHCWHRSLVVRAPVRCLARWQRPEVQECLTQLLEHLTEDRWELTFDACAATPRPSEAQRWLFPARLEHPVTAALFSGGLDSLAGAVADLSTATVGTLILIAAGTGPQLVSRQRELLAKLRRRFPERALPVVVPLGLRQTGQDYDRNEHTQRSRGFVFMALGAVAAMTGGAEALRIYENGIGAINLPYTEAQLGTQSTRSVHPEALARMSRFLEALLDRPFRVQLPYALATKGALCRALDLHGFGHLARDTVSCDGFPQRAPGGAQCGVCTSCVLRRQALAVAGIEDDGYRHDVATSLESVPENHLRPLADMLSQVERMRRCLDSGEPWHQLVHAFPDLFPLPESLVAIGACPAESVARSQVVSLLQRYCDEWAAFSPRPAGWEAI